MPQEGARARPSPPARTEPRPGFVAVGAVHGPHGVRGELKVEPLTDFPQRFEAGATLWAAGRAYRVHSARLGQGLLLLALDGVTTRDDAQDLRGLLLEVPEGDLAPLKEGRYFRHQLIGMAVVDRAGTPLGRLEQVLETGANDVYVVRDAEGELLVPAIDSVVVEVDVAGGQMVIEPMTGMERRPLKRRP